MPSHLIPCECPATPPSSLPAYPLLHSSHTTLPEQPGRSWRCTKSDRRNGVI